MRNQEQNIIAYRIPNSEALIVAQLNNGSYVVNVGSDGCIVYGADEIEEIYNFSPTKKNLERLGWTC